MAKPAAPADKAASTPSTPAPEQKTPTKAKGPTVLPGGCLSWGCKTPAARFNFCAQHYDHFKFGLIKKTGEPVPDYEKKFEHYQAFLAKTGARKAA